MTRLYVFALFVLCLMPLQLTVFARDVTVDDRNGDPETGRLVVCTVNTPDASRYLKQLVTSDPIH